MRPTLAVGLFAPLEQTSGAVMLELLFFYAFAHQDSFDVRWIARRLFFVFFFLLAAPSYHRAVSHQSATYRIASLATEGSVL